MQALHGRMPTSLANSPSPRWLLSARHRSSLRCKRLLASSIAATKSAAAAAEALASSTAPSTSAPFPRPFGLQPQQQGQHDLQQQQQQQQQLPSGWSYKYPHFDCSSPVQPDDLRGLQIEALFQNVLGYPRLPAKVHRFLQRQPHATTEQLTAAVEALDAKYGKELVLYMLRRTPHLLIHPPQAVADNADAVRSMLDLKGCEIFMVVRKNPTLLIIEPATVRERFHALHRITPLSHDGVKAMVRKYPVVLNTTTETVARAIEKLRHLAYTRGTWQQDFEVISPSLMAFFLRDSRDLLLRLEFLALTGDSATWGLFEVFKPSNNLFIRKHRGFRQWVSMREARRLQLQQRALLASQRVRDREQQQQREGLEEEDDAGMGTGR